MGQFSERENTRIYMSDTKTQIIEISARHWPLTHRHINTDLLHPMLCGNVTEGHWGRPSCFTSEQLAIVGIHSPEAACKHIHISRYKSFVHINIWSWCHVIW